MSPARGLEIFIPAISWLKHYRRSDLGADIGAGLTTAVMLIPQAMAYAMLAGLPAVIGLYASVLPIMAYALFGSSRHLAVGPVAMDSLLVAASVSSLAVQGSPDYLSYAIFLAFLVGIAQVSMGLLHLGFMTNFLSQPVLSGFTSAAALLIGISQLEHLLGYPVDGSQSHAFWAEFIKNINGIHLQTLGIGIFAIGILLATKRINQRLPSALIAVGLTTGITAVFHLDAGGVAIVGTIPAGLPRLAIPSWNPASFGHLWQAALTIAFVAFMEAISVAKTVARNNHYEINPNQELIGIGLANLAAALSGAYPGTGGFSRTAVNQQAGAKTQLAALVTALSVAISLLYLTSFFYYLPQATLAAIIISAVVGLIDITQVRYLYRTKRSDLVLLVLTFTATLTIGIQQGVLIGVGVSLLWFIFQTSRPHTALLGRLPDTEVYRNIKNHPQAIVEPGVLALRVDAQFYYGNVTFLKEILRRLERAQPQPLRAVVIDASSVNQLDSSAASALCEIANDYQQRKIRLLFANLKRPVWTVMDRAGLVAKLGSDINYLRTHDAMVAVQETPQHQ